MIENSNLGKMDIFTRYQCLKKSIFFGVTQKQITVDTYLKFHLDVYIIKH